MLAAPRDDRNANSTLTLAARLASYERVVRRLERIRVHDYCTCLLSSDDMQSRGWDVCHGRTWLCGAGRNTLLACWQTAPRCRLEGFAVPQYLRAGLPRRGERRAFSLGERNVRGRQTSRSARQRSAGRRRPVWIRLDWPKR